MKYTRSAAVMALCGILGCAGGPRAQTLDGIAGEWEGEWTWKSANGMGHGSGALKITLRRLDEKNWNIDLFAEGSDIPNDRVVLNLEEKSPTELEGEYQEASMKVRLDPVEDGTKIRLAIQHPMMGTAVGEGTVAGGMMNIPYTTTEKNRNGSGILSVKRKR